MKMHNIIDMESIEGHFDINRQRAQSQTVVIYETSER